MDEVIANNICTTDEVRRYWSVQGVKRASKRAKRATEFDRWLAEHDRAIKAEAWDEGRLVGITEKIGV